ncbi:MAG: hypothetical protein Tsb0020_14930 [Haliangiales bacterium]
MTPALHTLAVAVALSCAAVTTTAAAGCAYEYDDDASLEMYEPTWDGVALLFEHRCENCHGYQPGAGGVALPMDVMDLMDELDADDGALVVPGDPENSLLWQVLASGRMPAGDRPLPMAQIEHVRMWIEDGAVMP